MYRLFLISLILLTSLNEATYSQISEEPLDNIIKAFSDLSDGNTTYKLKFLKDKKTFVIEVLSKGVSENYKILEKDIHPEGVFFEEQKKSCTLKILSIDNGHRFIFTKLKNVVRLSNTTNIIEIKNINLEKRENLKKFIHKMRNYRKSLIKKKPKDPQIFVAEPKN